MFPLASRRPNDTRKHATLAPPARKVANVYAPGDIIITGIERVEYLGDDKKVLRADFSVLFATCRSVSGYYYHLSAVSDELAATIAKNSSNCDRYDINKAGAKSVNRCWFSVGRKLKAGAVIGQAGEQYSSFDFGLRDERVPALGFINPKRLGGRVVTVCPFDYYPNDIKQKFAGYFGSSDKKRTVPPVCGEIMQDKAGTAQGNWFIGDAVDSNRDWSKEVALVHNNIDPTQGVISAGGLNGQAFLLQFTPAHSGFKNREFSEILPGKDIYCYPGVGDGYYAIQAGQEVLLELSDTTHIKLELKNGNCSQPYAFRNPVIYAR